MKRVLICKTPDGLLHRITARTYTHVVVLQVPGHPPVGLSWCSSHKRAQAKLRYWLRPNNPRAKFSQGRVVIYPVESQILNVTRPNTNTVERLLTSARAICANAGQLFGEAMQDRILGVQATLSYLLTGRDSYVEAWIASALNVIAAAHNEGGSRCDCGACTLARKTGPLPAERAGLDP